MERCSDPYAAIADYYDLEHEEFNEDIAFYRQLLHRSPILEVGTGTGRIAVPLARDGLEVCGIDTSASMLARARVRAGSLGGLQLMQADVRSLALETRFASAIFGLNALWHLVDQDSQLQALRAVAHHLLPGALLVLDTSNPHSLEDREASGVVRQRWQGTVHGGEVRSYSSAWDDGAGQLLTLDVWYDRVREDGKVRRSSSRLTLRYVYRPELELLLRLAGFHVEHVYGSYDLDPYSTVSPHLLVTARPA
jgi:SAM-dependent methyltransferase